MEGMIRPPSNLTVDTKMKFDCTHIDAALAEWAFGVTAYITRQQEKLKRLREIYADFEQQAKTGAKDDQVQ